jgi:hypothetical protein
VGNTMPAPALFDKFTRAVKVFSGIPVTFLSKDRGQAPLRPDLCRLRRKSY